MNSCSRVHNRGVLSLGLKARTHIEPIIEARGTGYNQGVASFLSLG